MRRVTYRHLTLVVASILAMLVLAGAAGCVRPPAQEPAPAEPTPSVEQTSSSAPVPLERLALKVEPIARGFDQPLFLTHAGDGSRRLFVVEQGGRIRVVRNGAISPGAFLDLTEEISSGGERGLLGLAFPKDFAEHGRFYVDYTNKEGSTVIARFTASDPASDTSNVTGPEVLLRVQQPYANHNGGDIVFGPDGYLWGGMGDGGSGGDPGNNAQDPTSMLGKLLRLDVEPPLYGAATSGATYRIPPDNGSAKYSGWAPEIHAIGLRNPWRFSFDRENGELWIGDVGQNAWEEINAVATSTIAGSNFGWRVWEGTHPYPEGDTPSRAGFTFPVLDYSHEVGTSVTGGYVYRGKAEPELTGTYLYGDFGAGWIGGIRLESVDGTALAEPSQAILAQRQGSISSFGEDEEGEIYVLDYSGVVSRITASTR